MNISYSDKMCVLYIPLDEGKQQVINIGDNDRIVGTEILDASRHVNLETLFPVKYSTLAG